jgi:integrase
MKGNIRELVKGKRYELRIALGKDPVTGKYRQKSVTVRGTRIEARRELRRLLTDVENNSSTRDTSPASAARTVTFGELLDEWMTFKLAADRSPTTVDRYRRAIEIHLKPTLGPVPIRHLSAKLFDDLYREQLVRLKPATVLKNHLVARSALDRAVRWGWLDQNPADRADPPTVRRPRVRTPGTEEMARLLALAEESDPTFAVFLRVGAATGARRGELCALRWTDIDWNAKALTIERGIVLVRGGVVERATKTHNVRVVALDEGTITTLNAHRRHERAAALKCGVQLADDAFVFSRRPGGTQPLRPDNCTTTFEKLRKRSGLSGFSLKDATRHLAATRLVAAGVDVRTVAGRLGHARASTTLDIYSHFLPERDREAAQVLGSFLDRPPESESQGLSA